jgi:hypothetical protein
VKANPKYENNHILPPTCRDCSLQACHLLGELCIKYSVLFQIPLLCIPALKRKYHTADIHVENDLVLPF